MKNKDSKPKVLALLDARDENNPNLRLRIVLVDGERKLEVSEDVDLTGEPVWKKSNTQGQTTRRIIDSLLCMTESYDASWFVAKRYDINEIQAEDRKEHLGDEEPEDDEFEVLMDNPDEEPSDDIPL